MRLSMTPHNPVPPTAPEVLEAIRALTVLEQNAPERLKGFWRQARTTLEAHGHNPAVLAQIMATSVPS